MSSTYVDRGIIKWSPYDALVGYQSMLKELKYRLGKKEKSELSDDALEELNRALQRAVHEHLEIGLSYHHDGYVHTTFGRIRKLDFISKMVVMSTCESISADKIVEIMLP
ncbi:MAG: YolD-like family protein [Acholeplasmataceae bacterium]|nr:YolD-like family protein [Acholeplasmataceae bacterium]